MTSTRNCVRNAGCPRVEELASKAFPRNAFLPCTPGKIARAEFGCGAVVSGGKEYRGARVGASLLLLRSVLLFEAVAELLFLLLPHSLKCLPLRLAQKRLHLLIGCVYGLP